jgi:hypothetical protein
MSTELFTYLANQPRAAVPPDLQENLRLSAAKLAQDAASPAFVRGDCGPLLPTLAAIYAHFTRDSNRVEIPPELVNELSATFQKLAPHITAALRKPEPYSLHKNLCFM